jgi:hypothetical protein
MVFVFLCPFLPSIFEIPIRAHIPSAPTITNPDNNYNKLKIVLATSSNPSDFNYAIAISPDNFASTTQYVQADGTLGVTSTWQTYMQWGETSGTMIIGLTENTTYTVKVKAKQGTFSESAFGPVSQAATVGRTLALSLSTNTVNLGELLPSTVVTAGTQVTVTLATNNASGGTAYSYGQNNGLKSINTNSNIATTSNNLDGISEGYGIRGISTTQSSGGPMQILSPYNGSGNTIGSIDTNKRPLFDSSNQPITAGQGIFEIKAKISPITKAANDYIDIITIIAATNL